MFMVRPKISHESKE